MDVKNYEFKARIANLEAYESILLKLNPVFHGLDIQTDTYFHVPHGRLKLREGNIENALINYDREDIAGAKESKVILYRHKPDPALKDILIKQLGIKVIVSKQRKIYFIDNVKFHLDVVENLGTFLEVEVIDRTGEVPVAELKKQCETYMNIFGLTDRELMSQSYSDMLINLSK